MSPENPIVLHPADATILKDENTGETIGYMLSHAVTEQLRAVSFDDPELIGTLARVIENRHGTLHGIGTTLREALAELKRSRGTR